MKAEKDNDTYKSIGEVAKLLDLVNKKTGRLNTHTIRYWETQFKQIKPSVRAGGRRYYSSKDCEIITNIKFLLKDKGLTIKGVKKLLSSKETQPIEDITSLGVYKDTTVIKDKIKNISNIIKELKKIKNG